MEGVEWLKAGNLVITHGMEKARIGGGVRIKGREGEGVAVSELLKRTAVPSSGAGK
ncbi:MAG: hypothetical protein P8166_02660 [Candidatus Thiodiazotropha sp.]